jgi:hypothetical protein
MLQIKILFLYLFVIFVEIIGGFLLQKDLHFFVFV